MKLLATLLTLCFVHTHAGSQTLADDPRRPKKPLVMTIGAELGANVNFHSAVLGSFSSGENGIDCAGFRRGTSVTPRFGLSVTLPLSPTYAIHGAAIYDVKNVRFISDNKSTFVRRNGSTVDVSHALDVSLSYLTLQPMVVFSAPWISHLGFAAGGLVSLRLSSSIDQKIIETDGNGTTEEFSVPVDHSPHFSPVSVALAGRILYSLELARAAFIDAGIEYQLPITAATTSSGDRWNIFSLVPSVEVRLPF